MQGAINSPLKWLHDRCRDGKEEEKTRECTSALKQHCTVLKHRFRETLTIIHTDTSSQAISDACPRKNATSPENRAPQSICSGIGMNTNNSPWSIAGGDFGQWLSLPSQIRILSFHHHHHHQLAITNV